jgi:L-malate glycosyltransferase
MKILIITPSYFPKVTGNAVCTKRITIGLKSLNNEVMIVTPEEVDIKKIKEFRPDILHALHAYRSRVVMSLSKELKIPYIVTLTGSDYDKYIINCLNEDFNSMKLKKKKMTLEVMNNSSALVVYNDGTRERLLSCLNKISGLNEMSNKLFVIGKNIPTIKNSEYNFRKELGISKSDFLFTLIAGVRPIKNNVFPGMALADLQKQYDNLILALVGFVADEKYNELLKKSISDKKWIKYVGGIPLDKMNQVYLESDVILNSSKSEGESNAMVEAMFYSKPILASDVSGNSILVQDGINGYTYINENQTDFFNKAKELYGNKKLREDFAKSAKLTSNKIINKNEADDYLRLYSLAISNFEKNVKL